MKTTLIYIIICLFSMSGLNTNDSPIETLTEAKFRKEINKIEHLRQLKYKGVSESLDALYSYRKKLDKCDFIIQKADLEDQLWIIDNEADLEFTKLRYRKGIELTKMIYEKILGLDHHFTSLQTFKNISDLTNPNSFPEFVKRKDLISERMSSKKSVSMPALFDANPFVSLTTTLISSLIGDGEKKEKEQDLDKVACVLDFTVKMHADLNTIFYETEFLKQSNLSLKEEAITLFTDYCKVVDYHVDLKSCRARDDWDSLNEKLDETIFELQDAMHSEDSYKRNKYIKQLNNLEFSIDRLLTFIDSYSNFIKEGEKYYTKFNTILNSYQNEAACLEYLPHQFGNLKEDVDLSIAKFGEAYNISEIQGRKLRDLLYGLPE